MPDHVVSRDGRVGSVELPADEREWQFPLSRHGALLEGRADVDPLHELHHQRRVVMLALAPLKALHGSFGKWDARRSQLLAAIKVRVRRGLEASGGKVTESMVDAEAHADPQYMVVIDQGIEEATQYHLLQTELEEIEERIRSREIALLAYNQELKLQR